MAEASQDVDMPQANDLPQVRTQQEICSEQVQEGCAPLM